jgi:hypothetical protein
MILKLPHRPSALRIRFTLEMERALKLAGFFAAHAVWSISDGATLIPLVAFEKEDGKRNLVRFDSDPLLAAVGAAENAFKRNKKGARRAVMVLDGRITLPAGKVEALIVNLREFKPATNAFGKLRTTIRRFLKASPVSTENLEQSVEKSVEIALPYRPGRSPEGFAVYRPKFLSFSGFEPDFEAVAKSFYMGVDSHEKGAAVWNQALNERI